MLLFIAIFFSPQSVSLSPRSNRTVFQSLHIIPSQAFLCLIVHRSIFVFPYFFVLDLSYSNPLHFIPYTLHLTLYTTAQPSILLNKPLLIFPFLLRRNMPFPIWASLRHIFPMQFSDVEPILQPYLPSQPFHWFPKCHYHIFMSLNSKL